MGRGRSTLIRRAAWISGLRAAAGALAPHWGLLLALALFLVAGLAVLDDYGVGNDESTQRRLGKVSLAYISGDGGLPGNHNRFYGVAFEAPLVLAEWALNTESERAVHLSRHLLTHLLFLAGGLFAYLLARRLLGARLAALFATALFLLHPRLYAHSFINTKDIPFLVLFIVALYLAHRAFKKDALWAFALLGAAVGALVNIRIMGVALFAAVPAARALDFALAQGWAERKRVLLTTAAFALTGALAVYALLPYLWAEPVGRFAEWWTTLSQHPFAPVELFRGTLYRSSDFPADYLPVWTAITSPPFALALGITGAAAILARAGAAPGRAVRNARLRFGLLTLGCFALPILAVVALDSNLYTGWRQMYFLWAPFALLGAFGLQWLAASAAGQPRLRTAVYVAAGAGLAASVAAMALTHPNQHVAFNFFVDRVAPERLRTQYVLDYWGHPTRQALEWLLKERPSSVVAAHGLDYYGEPLIRDNAAILPSAAHARVSNSPSPDAFVIRYDGEGQPDLTVRRARIYNNTIAAIERKGDMRAVYAAAMTREPILDAVFNVHWLDGALAFVKEPCSASYITEPSFRLRAPPVDANDLPYWLRERGSESRGFPLAGYGSLFDGKCVARVPLPDYPIAEIDVEWSPELLADAEALESLRRARAAGPPAARSVYNVYLAEGSLVYAQDPCDPEKTEARFFLHIVPERESDLPDGRRQYGFDNLDFDFWRNGALVGDACIAPIPLPDYPMTAIRTGQFIRGEGALWRTEFDVSPSEPAT